MSKMKIAILFEANGSGDTINRTWGEDIIEYSKTDDIQNILDEAINKTNEALEEVQTSDRAVHSFVLEFLGK